MVEVGLRCVVVGRVEGRICFVYMIGRHFGVVVGGLLAAVILILAPCYCAMYFSSLDLCNFLIEQRQSLPHGDAVPDFRTTTPLQALTPVGETYLLMLNVKPTVSPRSLAKRMILQHIRAAHDNARSSLKDRDVLTPRPQPTVTSSDGTKTLRTRQHGNKTLPLPPLMDGVAIEAKSKYKKPKAAPEQREMTNFQKALAENPFGML